MKEKGRKREREGSRSKGSNRYTGTAKRTKINITKKGIKTDR